MKTGDRVIGIGSAYGIIIEGRVGTIIGNDEDGMLLVDFDERFNQYLHDGNDVIEGAKSQNGWFCKESNLKLKECE